jgi:hypothetical protein
MICKLHGSIQHPSHLTFALPAAPPLSHAARAASRRGSRAARHASGPSAEECLAKLAAAASSCSGCLNDASAVVYTRLDHIWGSRGNSAFRLDVPHFFQGALAAARQGAAAAPEPCCRAAAAVLAPQFQRECACLPEVARHTKSIDKELMDFCE